MAPADHRDLTKTRLEGAAATVPWTDPFVNYRSKVSG